MRRILGAKYVIDKTGDMGYNIGEKTEGNADLSAGAGSRADMKGMVTEMAEEFTGDEILTLTDEDGVESDYQLLASKEIDGVLYLALYPANDDENDEYIILKMVQEDGEDVLAVIESDEEFDRIADIFDNELFSDEAE